MNATETAPVKPERVMVPIETYELADGERVIIGVGHRYGRGYTYHQVLDAPLGRAGQTYKIESGHWWSQTELAPLIADYLEQASDLGHCPMSREALDEKLGRMERQQEAIS